MSAVDRTARPSTMRTSLWYSPGTKVPDQCARPIDAMTRLSISMKPGNGRPIHSLDVMVVRVATVIAASPITRAARRVAVRARGVVGKLSAMAPRGLATVAQRGAAAPTRAQAVTERAASPRGAGRDAPRRLAEHGRRSRPQAGKR